MNERIIFFQDGAKLGINPIHWEDIDVLTRTLAQLCRKDGFEITSMDPVIAAQKLFTEINPRDFSCVIDLSGLFGTEVATTFNMPSTTAFHLSRLRLASSARLDGIGFLSSLSAPQLLQLKDQLDLRSPLLIDDVSWSGRTVEKSIQLLGLDPRKTTVGFLAVNDGNFGDGKPGARDVLERLGTRVIAGESISTPQDDGFHLTDFFNLQSMEDAFDVIIEVQKLREEGADSDVVKNTLLDNIDLLFPNRISSEELRAMQDEGKFSPAGGIPKNSFFDINPPNWLMPSFSRRTSLKILRQNRNEIISVIEELAEISDEGVTDGTDENNNELDIMRGKERY